MTFLNCLENVTGFKLVLKPQSRSTTPFLYYYFRKIIYIFETNVLLGGEIQESAFTMATKPTKTEINKKKTIDSKINSLNKDINETRIAHKAKVEKLTVEKKKLEAKKKKLTKKPKNEFEFTDFA